MRLTDEQLAKHDILAQARVWAGTKYEYPLIDALVSELLTARRVVEAARDMERAMRDTSADHCVVHWSYRAKLDEALTAHDAGMGTDNTRPR